MKSLPEIVLEIGINHNGSASQALALIEEANKVVDRVGYPEDKVFFKFQKRNPEQSVPRHMWNKRRISPVSGRDVSYIEYKREIEFGIDEYNIIATEIPGRWFTSVWDLSSIGFMTLSFKNIPYIKIPSAHLVNDELIDECVITDIPLIMSTGMSTSKEILDAVERVPRGYPLTLLACVSSYPCWDNEIHLNKINILRGAFAYRKEIRFGYSNHSPSSYPSIYAGLLGAEIVELHITLNRALPGSDHAASLEMRAVELVLRELKRLPELFGPDEITVFPGELEKRKSLRGM